MSTNDEHDPVGNLHMQPAKGILKSMKSTDDPKLDNLPEPTHVAAPGMTRSESKSHKIPHFDEMNIIATYHPADKDYGHMKIEEPKTPYAPNDIIDEDLPLESTISGIDPNALTQRLKETSTPAPITCRTSLDRASRQSIDDDSDAIPVDIEHRKQFEDHRKKHYNEFEVVRLRRKEIEDELRALEQEEIVNEPDRNTSERMSTSRSSFDSIKPILVHHHHSRDSSTSSTHHHHVQVVEEDDDDARALTPEDQERKKQFEMKRKKHYDEFRTARLADKQDDDPSMTG